MFSQYINERAQLPPAPPLFRMVTFPLGTTAPEGPRWAPWDLKLYAFIRFSGGVSSPTKVKEPQPGGSLGPLQVCEYMISVKMNHFPRAWASQQPLPCFWGQNIMLGRVISILMLGPRSSKTSSLAWLTLVAKALSSRSERKLPSFQRHDWSWKSSGSERKSMTITHFTPWRKGWMVCLPSV